MRAGWPYRRIPLSAAGLKPALAASRWPDLYCGAHLDQVPGQTAGTYPELGLPGVTPAV